jgi:methanogenic corrinoid protein MtbC1
MSAAILEQIAKCVERGKINAASPYPPDMKGQDGADELTKKAVADKVPASDILSKGLVVGMAIVGEKFRANKIFVPEVLMAAKAMSTAMVHLKPFFESGAVKRKGVFVVGTVSGDLHDIGKNLVAMMIEGAGYEVVDLGVDVSAEKFLAAADKHPNCAIGLSALLTTTMVNMEKTVKLVKSKHPKVKVIVGGAPLTQEFANKIGADAYSADPQGAVDYLGKNVAA